MGTDTDGKPVYLSEIWPTPQEVQSAIELNVQPEMFSTQYGHALESNERWNRIKVTSDDLYEWNPTSTYIQEPPFLVDLKREVDAIQSIDAARVLCLLGDSVTTDHISPAGAIAKDSPAGRYLMEHGVAPQDFNSYGARRGNDRVMHRGTFANIRIRNQLAPGTEGGVTTYLPTGEVMPIYDASQKYHATTTPLIVLAGDGVRNRQQPRLGGERHDVAGRRKRSLRPVSSASIAATWWAWVFCPSSFPRGQTWQSLGLTGKETFNIAVRHNCNRAEPLTSQRLSDGAPSIRFAAVVRIDTPVELDYYRNGGILQTVLRSMLV